MGRDHISELEHNEPDTTLEWYTALLHYLQMIDKYRFGFHMLSKKNVRVFSNIYVRKMASEHICS